MNNDDCNKPFHQVFIENKKNEEFLAEVNLFIKNLENDYKHFTEIIENKKVEYKKIIENIRSKKNPWTKHPIDPNYKSDFEFSNKKSPLTIFHAPWGQGKTYFFESLIKYFSEKDKSEKDKSEKDKIKFKEFKNIWIIDACSYSSSSDIYDSLISEILLRLSRGKKQIKKQLCSFAANFYNIVARPYIERFTGIRLDKIRKKTLKEKYDKKIQNNNNIQLKKTIIIIDNIERLGDYSWEVLRAIFYLQKLGNLIIILPMNKSKLITHYRTNEEHDSEFPIEKYIDIQYYQFKQDYFGILNKFFSNLGDEMLNDLNEILSNSYNDKNLLSVRQVEKNLLNCNFPDWGYYNKLKYFCDKVWKNENIVKMKIRSDILKFISIIKDHNFVREKIKNDFMKWYIEIQKQYDINLNLNAPIYSFEKYNTLLELLQNKNLFMNLDKLKDNINLLMKWIMNLNFLNFNFWTEISHFYNNYDHIYFYERALEYFQKNMLNLNIDIEKDIIKFCKKIFVSFLDNLYKYRDEIDLNENKHNGFKKFIAINVYNWDEKDINELLDGNKKIIDEFVEKIFNSLN